MKQWLLVGITVSVFSFFQSSAFAQSHKNISSVTGKNYNVIFEAAPQDDDLLIAYNAFRGYHAQYKDAKGFKAFAQSEGGAWAYVTERESQEAANSEALGSCQGHNKTFFDSYPCQLVNINGQWISNDNRAKEILDSLPEFEPEEPIDLQKLRSNSVEDIEYKDYAQALAKRIWFHQHSLEVDEHYSAVRLSYNLSAWAKLGYLYPPARTLLRHIAYYSEKSLFDDPQDAYALAHEYDAVNRVLKREDQSAGFFKWLDKYHPETASRMFHLFQDELIKFELFSLYNDYVRPKIDYSQMSQSYVWSVNRKRDSEEWQQQQIDFATHRFIFEVSRLVAILAMHDRDEEAQLIVQKAKLELDSGEFALSLSDALEGKLPKPRT